jgi:cytochrome c oxidase cbb3-type subunit III
MLARLRGVFACLWPVVTAGLVAWIAKPALAEPADVELGRTLFERNCAVCHGIEGTGGRGPNLHRPKLALAPDDEALRALIAGGYEPEMPANPFLSDDDLVAVAAFVRSLGQLSSPTVTGNIQHGADVFGRSGCSACHTIDGHGRGYGPDLTDVGERRDAAYVRAALIDPEAHLPTDFLMVKATTVEGQVVTGIRVNEDTYTIQIKDPALTYHSYRKADLQSLEKLKGQTPMPSFRSSLSESDLQDLVAYLCSHERSP